MAFPGYGSTLKIGDGASPEVFTAIAELTNVSWGGASQDSIDTSHTASTNKTRTFIPGMKDMGEFSIEFNFLPDDTSQGETAGLLKALKDDTTVRNWQVVWSDTGAMVYSFAGFVTAFEAGASYDDKGTGSATIKVSGEITES